MLIHARLVALNVAVDDLLVAIGVERYRQPGAFNCRDGAIAKLRMSDPLSDCERTDGSGRGLCNRLRKGSFAAGFLSSSAGLLGALGTLGARHGQSPICLGSEKSKSLSGQGVAARAIAPHAYQGRNRRGWLARKFRRGANVSQRRLTKINAPEPKEENASRSSCSRRIDWS